MAGELAGQVAIVTGGGRGIGRAIAEAYAAAGAAVTVTARSADQLADTVKTIERAGGRALDVPGDVTRREDVDRVVKATQDRFGPVTILVNNAGVPWPFGPLWEIDPDRWWQAQAVHVRGALLYTCAVLPGMIERRGGRIITVASIGGRSVLPYASGYGVAKAGQIRLAEHVAAEGKAHGVVAFATEPGAVVTELAEETMADPAAQKWLPGFVQALAGLKQAGNAAAALAKSARFFLRLASGECDVLSGSFLTPDDDLAALIEEAKAAPPPPPTFGRFARA